MNLLNDFASVTAPDLLVRITLILAAAWLFAGLLRQFAAARHAILLAGISSAFLLPCAMLTLSTLSIPRWNIELATAATPVSTENSDSICLITTKSQETYAVRTAKVDSGEITTTVEPCATAGARSTAGALPGAPIAPAPRGLDWRVVLPIAVAVWAVVALLRCCGLALSLARLRNIVRRAHAVDPQSLRTLLSRIQRRVGLSRPPQLRESVDVSVPIAAGINGNYILLPAGWTSRLTRTELYSVLCHEAAHLARRDHRVVLLQEILSSLLWFHPLVHLVNRALTRAREEICDNYAIRSLDRPAYCAALFRLAGGYNRESLLAATSLSNRHWPLEERIRGILDERRPTLTGISRPTRLTISGLAVALCGLTTLPAITAAEPEKDSPEQSASASASATSDNIEVLRIRGTQSISDDVRSIRITSRNGGLTIDEADDGQLHAEAIVRIDTKSADPASIGDKLEDFVQLIVENGVLTILPRVDSDKPNDGLQVDLAISVPAGLAIEAESNDGDVAVNQVEANLVLVTHDGQIALRSFVSNSVTATAHDGNIIIESNKMLGKTALSAHSGDVAVNADQIRAELDAQSFDGDVGVVADSIVGPLIAVSHTGDVAIEILDSKANNGEITLTTQDGDIALSAPAAKKVAANTAHGDIMLHFAGDGVQEALAAAAADGDVHISAAHGTNADLALVTQGGEITIEGRPASGNIISTQLGNGGPKYAVVTSSGSIVIKTGDANTDGANAAESP